MQTQSGQAATTAPQQVDPFTGQATAATTIAAPVTLRDLEALRSRRSELSNQLISSANRRERLMNELNRAPTGPARIGLEQRIGVLDKRILQLETDIAETGRQLTSSQAGLLTATQQTPFFGLSPRNVTTISTFFILFVLAPLALAAARNLWRRGNRPPPPPPDVENSRRLDQIQQSVDAIALEVERVSEGQRFVTKILAEQKSVPVIGGAKEGIDATISARSEPYTG